MASALSPSHPTSNFTPASIAELISIHLYDSVLISPLETYVNEQLKSRTNYDADANRHLLKLYMFFPSQAKIDIISKILIKSLMELPSIDHMTFSYMINDKLSSIEPIKTVMKLAHYLDNCQFKLFWKLIENNTNNNNSALKNDLDNCDGFEDRVRQFIALTISHSYINVPIAVLKENINLSDNKLDEWIQLIGWKKIDANTVEIPSSSSSNNNNNTQSNNNKQGKTQSNIQDAVSIEQISRVVASYS